MTEPTKTRLYKSLCQQSFPEIANCNKDEMLNNEGGESVLLLGIQLHTKLSFIQLKQKDEVHGEISKNLH